MFPASKSTGVPATPEIISVIPPFALPITSAVVIIADRMAAELQSLWAALNSVAMPAAWGHDMDVPKSIA